ncbi:Nif3-like dinuclear metal center hexameric protein, partial [Chitinimonas sp.]|uniref:Nif3-like dinuclear metal center hexameric protein n=1 Tax=Chitinimonas sp. TaxID=1934313 RepID=UPI0035B3B3EB
GRPDIQRLLCGVTASAALIDHAIAWQADAILVHHGYFWRGEDPRIIGSKRQRLAKLLQNDISLLAYHLPLDAHPEFGNNATLGRQLGLITEGRCGEQDLVCVGRLAEPASAGEFLKHVESRLGRKAQLVGDPNRAITRIGWCSGGAQGYLAAAVAAGCDCYLTGEASEPSYHDAIESGVTFIAAGHHATERYGVQALGEHLAGQFGLTVSYHELDNPF